MPSTKEESCCDSVLYTIWTHNPTSSYSKKAEKLLLEIGEVIPNPKTEQGTAYIQKKSLHSTKCAYTRADYVSLLPPKKQVSICICGFSGARLSFGNRTIRCTKHILGMICSILASLFVPETMIAPPLNTPIIYYLSQTQESKARKLQSSLPSLRQGRIYKAILLRAHIKRYPADTPKNQMVFIWSLIKTKRYKDAITKLTI